MLTYLSLISYLLVIVLGKRQPLKSKSSDLSVVESEEHNFLESPSSIKGYRQNNGYSNEEGGSAPEPYMFNYDIQDNDNNKQFRKEESNGNAVKGSYGYVDSNGLYRTVEYTADSEYGFRAKVKTNEPGIGDYYTDNSRAQTIYPADVVLEVAESPRNLQYSSSDQLSNNYRNYQSTKNRNYQQFNDFDQYAASNNHNYDTQKSARSLANEQVSREHLKEPENNQAGSYISSNNYADKGKGFEYQSAFSDGHPVYVDSKSSKVINSVSASRNPNRSSIDNTNNDFNENGPELTESKSKVTFMKNLKFNNKTVDRKEASLQVPTKKLPINLQLEKPIQQYKFVQQFRPFHEIRQKFLRAHPRRFTGFVNNIR